VLRIHFNSCCDPSRIYSDFDEQLCSDARRICCDPALDRTATCSAPMQPATSMSNCAPM